MANWRRAFQGAALGISDLAGQQASALITDRVAQKREARMAKYQQAQTADQRQYQEGQADVAHGRNLEMMGLKNEADMQQAQVKRAQELADAEVDHQRDQDNIRLRADIDPQASTVTVENNMGQDLDARTKKFSEAIGSADAELYTATRAEAKSAIQMEDSLNVLEEMQSKFETGKTQEALAILGQWAGTDAGAAMQAWEGTISPIVLAKAEGLSGVLSDKDMEFLKASVPTFGRDKKANQIMIGLMRKGMDRALENEKSMQAHINEFGNLNNWTAPNQQGNQVNASSAAQTNIVAADDPLGLFD